VLRRVSPGEERGGATDSCRWGSTVEYFMGYEGGEFGFTGNIEEDLLGITSVHPMRKDSVREYLNRAGRAGRW
jgi:wyosine [tRNA(Phe)-imidazoG37] synthetase (radical SAM superfamily)